MANKNTATHRGTCQACGHFQKLPGGVLSRHGYAVKWNQFVGTCPGSGRRPFNTHTDFIAECIANAEVDARGYRRRADDLAAAPLTGKVAWHRSPNPGGRSYGWREVAFEVAGERQVRHGSTDTYGRESTRTTWGTAESFERDGRSGYIHHLLSLAKLSESYAAWQRERVASWVETPLTPVA
jgi:hypothetical protein